ncbi:hypothetical protein ACJX0J_042071 [Zea mays]
MTLEAFFSFLISYLISSSLFFIDNSDTQKIREDISKEIKKLNKAYMILRLEKNNIQVKWATKTAQKLLHNDGEIHKDIKFNKNEDQQETKTQECQQNLMHAFLLQIGSHGSGTIATFLWRSRSLNLKHPFLLSWM